VRMPQNTGFSSAVTLAGCSPSVANPWFLYPTLTSPHDASLVFSRFDLSYFSYGICFLLPLDFPFPLSPFPNDQLLYRLNRARSCK